MKLLLKPSVCMQSVVEVIVGRTIGDLLITFSVSMLVMSFLHVVQFQCSLVCRC